MSHMRRNMVGGVCASRVGPMAYPRLPEVIAEHAGTIRVLHTLRPFAVAMAGAGEFDPFKD
jgi:tRNA-splicing ligase RtcB